MKNMTKENKQLFGNIITFIGCVCALTMLGFIGSVIKTDNYGNAKAFLFFCAGIFAGFIWLYLWQFCAWLIIRYNKCPLCGKFSLRSRVHNKCTDYEAMMADRNNL